MTDAQIINHLKNGQTLHFGCNGRNEPIMSLMARLEKENLIKTWDLELSQETRRAARWIGDTP